MRLLVFGSFCLFALGLRAQDAKVSGTVSSPNNAPLAAVNVLLKGTAMGTVTDINGNFSLLLPEGEVVLIFASITQKRVEHEMMVRNRSQYQIRAVLASKWQTFHASKVKLTELPADAPVLSGRILTESGDALAGVRVTQEKSDFSTFSRPDGSFALPLGGSDNTISFRLENYRPLDYHVTLKTMVDHSMEAILVTGRLKDGRREGVVTFFGPVDNSTQ